MTSPTTTLTEAEQRQCEHIWKRYWNIPDPIPERKAVTLSRTLFQWALLHWDKLEPHVDRDVRYAITEGIQGDEQHWARRIATKVERRVQK